jgi:small subunit ribosomal protein S17
MNKTLVGTVISNKMMKTVIVSVERKYQHPTYKKIIIRHRKFKVHNEKFDLKINDLVKIQETKPFSKGTYFLVVEKLSPQV